MREIEFRGKRKFANNRKSVGEWEYGYLWEEAGLVIGPNMMFAHMVFPETVGQYTGLKDKNGAKIFEGDIITASIAAPGKEFLSYLIKWCDGGYGWFVFAPDEKDFMPMSWLDVDKMMAEVIGNIHDSPELLEEENKCPKN